MGKKKKNVSTKWVQKETSKVTQLTCTCSKSTIETLEIGVKYVQN